jgi:hypothetical protein
VGLCNVALELRGDPLLDVDLSCKSVGDERDAELAVFGFEERAFLDEF